MTTTPTPEHRFQSLLLGTATGDALGLPREGLSRRRAGKIFGTSPLRHRFLLNRGLISDDTDHACMTAQALLASNGNLHKFQRSLAWRLRGWLLSIPAGIGLATLKSILKLWCGFPPSRSGVRSAGNGPAMRAPIVGLWCAAKNADDTTLQSLVRAATQITHRDERAYEGALLIALATRLAAESTPSTFTLDALMQRASPHIKGEELLRHLDTLRDHLARNASPQEFAAAIGAPNAISGYINQTVPAVLYCCLQTPSNFQQALENLILLGGDSDSTAALAGAILATLLGLQNIPQNWLQGLRDYPRSAPWLQKLGTRLAAATPQPKPLPLPWPAFLLRNPFFTAIVLLHGFRRLLPPY